MRRRNKDKLGHNYEGWNSASLFQPSKLETALVQMNLENESKRHTLLPTKGGLSQAYGEEVIIKNHQTKVEK